MQLREIVKIHFKDRILRNRIQFSIGWLLLFTGFIYEFIKPELQDFVPLVSPIPVISLVVGVVLVIWAGIQFPSIFRK